MWYLIVSIPDLCLLPYLKWRQCWTPSEIFQPSEPDQCSILIDCIIRHRLKVKFKILFVKFVGHIDLRSLTGGHFGRQFNISTLRIKPMFHFNRLYHLISNELKLKCFFFIEYVGQIGLRSLNDGHFGRHL